MIILDLDNTIADDEWRIPYIQQGLPLDEPARYFKYHLLSPFDWLRNEHLLLGRGSNIAIFTSRPEEFRVATEEWLRRNGVNYKWLSMRGYSETQGSVELKAAMLDQLFTAGQFGPDRIINAYDDRQDVIDMYRAAGVNAERVFIHNTPYRQENSE